MNATKSQKRMLLWNGILIALLCILNWFYQKNHFDFTLKCICSSLFALQGICNLVYALVTKQPNRPFYIAMGLGMVLAMVGDVTLGIHFALGAGIFALGHISFATAYGFLQKNGIADFAIGGIIFLCAAIFLLFCPALHFDTMFQTICLAYALIISVMLGKAIANVSRQKSPVNCLLVLGSFLFFFSDFMLVLDWFTDLGGWTGHACMGTYYPALCLLGLGMLLQTILPVATKN